MTASEKRLLWVLAAFLLMQALANLIKYGYEVQGGASFGGDFAVFWNAAKSLVDHSGAIYNPHDLQNAITLTNDGTHAGETLEVIPFMYPPPMALVVWPLGFLSRAMAVALWSAIPIIAFFLLLWLHVKPRGRAFFILASCFMLPFLAANLFSGQSGTLLAALFMAGLYGWRKGRWWAGIWFGMMVIKPQLAVLLPLAFVASAEWKLIAVTGFTALLLTGIATCLLGAHIWVDYVALLGWFGRFAKEAIAPFAGLATGPYLSLHVVGVPQLAATIIQTIITIAVVATIIWAFRDKDPSRFYARAALLSCGVFLASPYSLVYDSPFLAIAVLAFLMRIWEKGWSGIGELAVFIGILVMPYAQFVCMRYHIPYGFMILLLFFAVLAAVYRKEKQGLA